MSLGMMLVGMRRYSVVGRQVVDEVEILDVNGCCLLFRVGDDLIDE